MNRHQHEAWSSADLNSYQRAEIAASLRDLDEGNVVSHEDVAKWLTSWGTVSESKPPLWR